MLSERRGMTWHDMTSPDWQKKRRLLQRSRRSAFAVNTCSCHFTYRHYDLQEEWGFVNRIWLESCNQYTMKCYWLTSVFLYSQNRNRSAANKNEFEFQTSMIQAHNFRKYKMKSTLPETSHLILTSNCMVNSILCNSSFLQWLAVSNPFSVHIVMYSPIAINSSKMQFITRWNVTYAQNEITSKLQDPNSVKM